MNTLETRLSSPCGIWYLDSLGEVNSARTVSIISSPFQVGRSPERAPWLPFPNISKAHAELICVQGGLLLRDLGSTNGTFVNLQRIETEVFLNVGDAVHFAQVGFRVGCWSSGETSATTVDNPWQEALQTEIDQRRETERELWNSQAKFHALLDAVGESILSFDTRGLITGCNPAAEKLFGISLADLVRTPVTSLLPLLATRPADNTFDPAGVLMDSTCRHKTTALRKVGGPFSAEIVTSQVQLAGDQSYVVIVRDITAEEQAKQELHQATQVAEAACRAKGEFLANMSHEIRTPLTTILGYTETLLSELQQIESENALSSNAETFSALEIIHRNGNHLLGIVNNILDLTKIEAGQTPLESIAYSIPRLIDDVRCLTEFLAQEKGLQLEFQLDANLPAGMLTDPMRLRQILVNLIGNAIKFTQRGCVRVKISRSDDPSAAPSIIFEVVDSGIGMSPNQVQTLFQRYTQGPASIPRRFGGTGLGLSISERLTSMLGGHIEVESELGHGTRMRVVLPLLAVDSIDQEEDSQLRQAASDCEQLANLKILVADDDADIRALLDLMLTMEGAQATLTNDGLEMLQAVADAAAENKSYDLVIMDLQMPVMDGHTAIRQLRQLGIQIPVLTLTANAMLPNLPAIDLENRMGRLTKPIRRETLRTAIRQLCPPETEC